ncbi:MAG TPA: CHAT domain-containing protein, partial [Thermoanaerobaculia bacterium]|nr:CHAT domain-containing protein [Thermoanaerobaculia bacterium]
RAVLASLWSVEDEPARRFVLRFYAEGGLRDPAPALARAQRAAIAAGEPPSAWAPFVLVATQ